MKNKIIILEFEKNEQITEKVVIGNYKCTIFGNKNAPPMIP